MADTSAWMPTVTPSQHRFVPVTEPALMGRLDPAAPLPSVVPPPTPPPFPPKPTRRPPPQRPTTIVHRSSHAL